MLDLREQLRLRERLTARGDVVHGDALRDVMPVFLLVRHDVARAVVAVADDVAERVLLHLDHRARVPRGCVTSPGGALVESRQGRCRKPRRDAPEGRARRVLHPNRGRAPTASMSAGDLGGPRFAAVAAAARSCQTRQPRLSATRARTRGPPCDARRARPPRAVPSSAATRAVRDSRGVARRLVRTSAAFRFWSTQKEAHHGTGI